MRIGLVNLIAKTSEVLSNPTSVLRTSIPSPRSDADLNIVGMGRRIVSRGHEVRIFVADDFRPRESVGGSGPLRIEYLPTRLSTAFPPSVAPLTPSLISRLKGERFDIVQTGELFQPGTLLSWIGSGGIDTRMFIWQELDVMMRPPAGFLQQGFYRTLGKVVVGDCARVIPRSLSARDHLLGQSVPEEKIAPVVHSGVDTEIFRPMDKESCRKAFDIDGVGNIVLAVSRLDPIKGLDTLIRAMTVVSEEIRDSLLVIQGNGPAYPELLSLVRSLGIEGNVKFIAESFPHDSMPPLYNIADVLAITSRIDLFPFVAIEAISCGIPLATSFARGLKTDIVDKGGGVMLPQDHNAMGEALVCLLQDRSRLSVLARDGRELAAKEFDFEVCADRFLKIYEGTGA
jgi:glycosyltransferase involved in cell wall biosynthesis